MKKRPPKKIILASASPSRRAQLKNLRIPFQVYPSHFEEETIKTSRLALAQMAKKLAKEKAFKVLLEKPQFKEHIVLSGDQMACLNKKIFDKALSQEGAKKTLLQLQGKTHILYTAIFMSYKDKTCSYLVKNYMRMRKLSHRQIQSYIKTYPKVKITTGSYALEQGGISLFSSIRSEDHSAIIGFPLIFLINQLQKWGYPLPFEK